MHHIVLKRINSHAEPIIGSNIELFPTAEAAETKAEELKRQFPDNVYFIGSLDRVIQSIEKPYEIVKLD